MNSAKELIGFIRLNQKDHPFTFKDWVVTIFFDDMTEFNEIAMTKCADGVYTMPSEPKLLDSLELDAIDSNNNRIVKFQLADGKVYSHFKSPGPPSIQLVVKYYFFSNINPKPSDKTIINVWSNGFADFLSLKPIYDVNIVDNRLEGRVFCNSDTLNMTSKGVIDGLNYEIKPTFRIENHIHSFYFYPGISISINKSLDYKEIYSLSESLIRKAVAFVFGRNNITFDCVSFSNWTTLGEMVINYVTNEKDEIPKHHRDDLSIPWRIIYPHFVNLLSLIKNDNFDLKNMQDKRVYRFYVSDVSIAKDAAAFEAEFRFTFKSDYSPYSEDRKQLEDEIIEELDEKIKKYTGDKKRIYKSFKKNVHQQSLYDKILYCLNEYSNCLQNMMNKFSDGHSFEDIASTCGGTRNSVVHNKKKEEAPMREPEAFIILRGLIYSMQLKRIGMNNEEIKNSLAHLFKIYD